MKIHVSMMVRRYVYSYSMLHGTSSFGLWLCFKAVVKIIIKKFSFRSVSQSTNTCVGIGTLRNGTKPDIIYFISLRSACEFYHTSFEYYYTGFM